MSSDRTKRAAEIQDSIRKVLVQDWNPIGIDVPDDEYDANIAPVYRILAGSRSKQELLEYLSHTEEHTIGVGAAASYDHLTVTVEKLLALDVSLG
jgi:hypothetical protein